MISTETRNSVKGVQLERQQRMEMLLRHDDVQTLATEFDFSDIQDWCLTNIVDVMNDLPKTLDYWIGERKKQGGFRTVS